MKELSIFIDESGDFGKYSHHSPYYIITMIMHDQSNDIEKSIQFLEHELTMLGYPDHCVHTGPIIRQEEDYKNIDLKTRRRIFNKMVAFFRQLNITYKTFYIEKRKINELEEATEKLSKQITQFIKDNYSEFLSYSLIKIYYDNGQIEVNKILKTVLLNYYG